MSFSFMNFPTWTVLLPAKQPPSLNISSPKQWLVGKYDIGDYGHVTFSWLQEWVPWADL